MQLSRMITIVATGLILACGGGEGPITPPPPPPPPPPPAVASVTVTPPSTDLAIGATAQLSAAVKDAEGNTLVRAVTWTSSASAVASVSSTGLVTAKLPGNARITATSDGKSGEASIDVVQEPVASVEVTPPTSQLEIDETVQLVATTFDGGGAVVTGRSITWQTSDATSATVSATGLVTAKAAGGPVTITASSESKSGTATVTVSAPSSGFVSLATAFYHTCGLTADGVAWCWGENDVGQLGTGTSGADLAAPAKVATSLRFKSITLAWAATCALTIEGKAWCWGENEDGTLGNGGFSSSLQPVAVGGNHTFTEMSAGEAHVCGIDASADAWCWGAGADGQIGDGGGTDQVTPVLVAGSHKWQQITPAVFHTCGLTQAGNAYCWGLGEEGQLGDGASIQSLTPVAVTGGHVFTTLSSGEWHTCGLKATGAVWCWGWNDEGQLGDGTTNDTPDAVQVVGGDSFLGLTASGWSTCGLLASGAVKCWGENAEGELGIGNTTDHSTPVAVAGGHLFSSLAEGLGYHFCARRTDDKFMCWGSNGDGQIGNGSFVDVLTPTLLADPPS